MDDKVKGVEIDPVKEKLIEAVGSFKFPIESGGCTIGEYIVPYRIQEPLVDHLIAYGVVISNSETTTKWIPVTERLPEIPDGWKENPEPVLYMMKNTKTIYAGYYGEGGLWRDKYFREYADSRNGVDADDVLCWMWQHDLPEPPKGE